MDYSILPPELFNLLSFKLNMKKYESDSYSQILNACHVLQSDTGIKQYFFPIKISGVLCLP